MEESEPKWILKKRPFGVRFLLSLALKQGPEMLCPPPTALPATNPDPLQLGGKKPRKRRKHSEIASSSNSETLLASGLASDGLEIPMEALLDMFPEVLASTTTLSSF